MCTCKENNWVRNIERTAYPMSEHAKGCEEYAEEKFVKVILDGSWCIVEPKEVRVMTEGDYDYVCEDVFMTRDQFNNLPEFSGF